MYISEIRLKTPYPKSNFEKYVLKNNHAVSFDINKYLDKYIIGKEKFTLVLYWKSCIFLIKLK